jgi:hypothetical protein
MNETVPLLQEWESFYVIVGSSAGALTGLQFVVLTLITESGAIRGSSETLSAFASPNVVHFCAALLVSAILSAPWHGLGPPGFAIALFGVLGFLYSVTVLRRAQRQKDYKPVLEDWIWHAALPLLAYAALVYGGIRISNRPDAPYIAGGATLLLVFIGIHNAWDTVIYVMIERTRDRRAQAAARKTESAGRTSPAAVVTPAPAPPPPPATPRP